MDPYAGRPHIRNVYFEIGEVIDFAYRANADDDTPAFEGKVTIQAWDEATEMITVQSVDGAFTSSFKGTD